MKQQNQLSAVERVLADSQDAILVLDGEGRVRLANAAAVALFGDRVAEGARFGMPVGSDGPQELLVPRSDGTILTVEMRVGRSSWDGQSAMVVTLRDVTERKRFVDELEARERLLLATGRVARVGGWEVDVASGRISWSTVTKEIHEVPPDYRPTLDQAMSFFDPGEQPRLAAAYEAALTRGEPYDLEVRFVTARGKQLWTHTRCMPVVEDGQVVKLVGTFQDITRRKAVEQELRAERNRAQRYLDIAAVMLLGLDATGKVTLINRRGCEVLSLEDEREILGRSWLQHIPADERDQVRQVFDAMMRGEVEPHRRVEGRVLTTEGETRTVVWHNAVLHDQDGTVTGTLSSGEDVTERREMEAQLAQADRLASMGMLAAGVAHEINNPLSYTLYNLESLARDLPGLLDGGARTPTDPALRDDLLDRLKDALEGIHRIQDVARGLGTFSRVEHDHRGPVDLSHVIDVAVSMAGNELKYRAQLVKDLGKVPPVLASEGRLSQVFLNLLINAAHAIDEGDVEHNQIRVRTWAEAGDVLAEVSDTGCGIPPAHMERLFDPFFTTKEVGAGSGLGLAISRNIVESYGGQITVQSEPGQGTCFTIRLPAHTVALEPAVTAVAAPAQPGTSGRVLIVDDEPGIRSVMARVLREHETVQAATGAEAREILEQDQAFDVILCDMMMSEVSGMDLHRWLAADHPDLAEQLIFVTGGAFTPGARDYLDGVANIRLEKPFDPTDLKKLVNDHVRLAQDRAAAR